MADYLSCHNGILHKDVLFTRAIHDWEMSLQTFILFFSSPSKLIGMVKTGRIGFRLGVQL